MTESMVASRGYFSTGVVERMTGLSAHTLRAWERRYGLSPSQRTASGQRAFSREDVERYQLLKRLLEQGFRIGQIARLDARELRGLIATTSEVALPGKTAEEPPAAAATSTVVVVGEFLSALLDGGVRMPGWRVKGFTDLASLLVSLQGASAIEAADWLVAEVRHIDAATIKQLLIAARQLGHARLALAYRFATQHQINALKNSGITLLSYPARGDDPLQWLRQVEPVAPPEPVSQSLQAPRFSRQRLAAIVRDNPTVECECPQHLARLVDSLVDFEQYSEQCQVENIEDAALHAELCALSGRARMLMEDALETVLRAEGLALEE